MSVDQLLKSGIDVSILKGGGYTLSELKGASISLAEMRALGFQVRLRCQHT